MSGTAKKPEIVVFAGPNGSGKSTFTKNLRPLDMIYINADDIRSALGCDDKEAAEIAEARREACLAARQDFCFETVLSTDRNLKLLQRAKESGYFIRCYYVLTYSPYINVARVSSRVTSGGHNVPEDKIISRYRKALALVHEVIPVCDVCHIYDNSNQAHRIFKKRKEKCWYAPLKGHWLKEDIVALTGIKEMERGALNKY